MSADRLAGWDGDELIAYQDRPTGAWIFVAIHSTRLGPTAAGGTRMARYENLAAAQEDALRLSRAMTHKMALADFPFGGAKAVVALPARLAEGARPGLLRRYGALVGRLGGRFLTGPDLGTSAEDMDLIAETGAPYVHCRTRAAGGTGGSGPATAIGVLTAIEVVARRLGRSLEGLRVLVQGLGSVGGALVELLLEAGAEVLISDTDPVALARHPMLEQVAPERLAETACDVYAPCAVGGTLDDPTIAALACRAVVGSANNQLAAPSGSEALARRGILYAPDIAVNIGGLIAILGMEQLGWDRQAAWAQVREVVARTLTEALALADAEGLDTQAAALALAERRLRDA